MNKIVHVPATSVPLDESTGHILTRPEEVIGFLEEYKNAYKTSNAYSIHLLIEKQL